MWKILSANIKAIDDKGHVKFFTASQVTISIKGENKPSEKIPEKKKESVIHVPKILKPKKKPKKKSS